MTTKKWPAARIAKLWLDIGLVLLGLAIVVLVLWFLVTPFLWHDRFESDLTVLVSVGERTLLPVYHLDLGGPPSAGLDEFRNTRLVEATGELRMLTTRRGLHYLGLLGYAVGVAIAWWVLWMIRAVVKSALEGRPFERVNSRRLRNAGLVILVGSVAWPLSQYFLAVHVLKRVAVQGLPLAAAVPFSSDPMLIGLLLLVLAAVFSHGADLEDERSLTV